MPAGRARSAGALVVLGLLLAVGALGAGAGWSRTGTRALSPVASTRALGPAPYRLPQRAAHVSSSRQLQAALNRSRPRNIVLKPGIYDNHEPFLDHHGHRLYAGKLGRVVLRAGIALGANSGSRGSVLRGLRFDVSDPAKTLYDQGIIHVWGSRRNTKILDTRLDGHGAVEAGIFVRQPEGFVARRVVTSGFRSYGILVDPHDSDYRARSPYLLSNVTVSHVARPVRGSSMGTAEACLWLGSQGVVRRASLRDCGIAGVWTGAGNRDSLLDRIRIDQTDVGVYLEHFTTGTTFRRLHVGPNVSRGVNAEWADPVWGGRPASVDNVFRDSRFHTKLVGVYLDEGTTRTRVVRSKFIGQSWAGIGDFRGTGNSFSGNNFKGLDPGAVPISHGHLP